MINPYRIKVISSEQRVQETYINPIYKNEPSYTHRVVVSPSMTNDLRTPKELIE